jgi:exo-1,4-beta-D-glucosaminidase
VAQPVSIAAGEQREIGFTPDDFDALVVDHPDLWWPYTMGNPDLYDLALEFIQNGTVTTSSATRFGIRTVAQARDSGDPQGADGGGNFYLKINGRDFLVRGATYTPDLLYRYDPDRDAAILRYAKDLGVNMLRLESKISSARFVEQADELGIPLMYGWMCCNQWEKWQQWDDEDRRVATESLRSQIEVLRSHPSVFVWANGSDGRPPEDLRTAYRTIIDDLHWQNATVDTVSAFARDPAGKPLWDGIQMSGPYTWRPPTYWFSGRYGAARGSSAEQGDNEHIPPYASLRQFIPPDKMWPINDTWYFHAGTAPQNSTLSNVRRVIDRRYGLSTGAQMFADKAQLAHYEATRAQFESFAANGWDGHKMTIYWMLNSHWPSFFGNIFDYYLRPGGAYYGAKQGLRPLSVVFDSYATGDHRQAKVTVVNQSPDAKSDLRVRVRTYDLSGRLRDDRAADGIDIASGGTVTALTLPPGPADSRVFFVRCELLDAGGGVLAENVYWQSQVIDDVGAPENDDAFQTSQYSYADMTALNTMPKPTLAALPGAAAGAGLSLALACDMRVMSSSAIMTTAFARVGFSGDYGGTYFLTQLVGSAKAREMYYLSDRVSAEEALRLGLTNWVCAPDELTVRTREIALRLAKGPTVAYRYMKENLNRAMAGEVDECLDLEATHHVHCGQTQDHREATQAFVAKREPVFTGR